MVQGFYIQPTHPTTPSKTILYTHFADFGPILMKFGMEVKNGEKSLNPRFKGAGMVLPSTRPLHHPTTLARYCRFWGLRARTGQTAAKQKLHRFFRHFPSEPFRLFFGIGVRSAVDRTPLLRPRLNSLFLVSSSSLSSSSPGFTLTRVLVHHRNLRQFFSSTRTASAHLSVNSATS